MQEERQSNFQILNDYPEVRKRPAGIITAVRLVGLRVCRPITQLTSRVAKLCLSLSSSPVVRDVTAKTSGISVKAAGRCRNSLLETRQEQDKRQSCANRTVIGRCHGTALVACIVGLEATLAQRIEVTTMLIGTLPGRRKSPYRPT